MNSATVTGIILATAGAIILGMAALIRAMVTDKLDSIVGDIKEMRKHREDDSGKIHQLETRVSVVEARCGTWPGQERRCDPARFGLEG